MPRHVIQSSSAPMAIGMVLEGNFLCFGTYLHYQFSVLKPLLMVLKLDLPKVRVGFGLITLKEREINPLGLHLSGLVADLARAAHDGRGEGTGDTPPAA